MIIYNNITELSASQLVVGDVVQVLGEDSPGDRAVMVGIVREASFISGNRLITIAKGLKVEILPELVIAQENADTSTVAATNSTTRRTLADRFADVVNVRDFGAKGDGVSDDTLSFRSAIGVATSSSKTVYIPKGIYKVEDVDTLDAPIIGELGAELKATSGLNPILVSTSDKKVEWANFGLQGENTSKYAYKIGNASSVLLSNINVSKFTDRCCIFEQPVRNVNISGGFVSDCTGGDVFVVKSNKNTISGVIFNNISDHAIRFGRFSSDADIDSGCNSVVSGCVFTNIPNDPVLCELNSKYISISDNSFEKCRNIAKVTKASDNCHSITISGNTFKLPQGVASGFTRGVSATESYRVIIANNIIDLTGATVGGLEVSSNTGIAAGTNCTVSNNLITGTHTTGISLLSGCTVSSNTVDGFETNGIVASGGTNTLVGNKIISDSNSARAIRVAGSEVTVTGNVVKLSGSGTTGFSGTTSATYALVVGNNFRSASIPISSAGSGSISENNII